MSRRARGLRPRLVVLLAASTLASVLGLAPNADAATWTVKCDEDKLIEAINGANATPGGDTISLKKGCTYEFDWADNNLAGPSATPVILDGPAAVDLVIKGNGAKLVRSDDADAQAFRLLTSLGGVVIKDLTVARGFVDSTPFAAAGILVAGPGSSLTATNLKVFDNDVYVVSDTTTAGAVGAGITCSGCAALDLSKSTVAGNVANAISMTDAATAFGAGITALDGDETLLEVTLLKTSVKANESLARGAGSSAESQGGGLVVSGGTLVLDDSEVSKNLAKSTAGVTAGGGVVASAVTSVTMTDSKVSGNTAIGEDLQTAGGGLVLSDAVTTTVTGSEISKNTLRTDGGLAAAGGLIHFGGVLTVDDADDEDESTEINDNKVTAEGFGAQAIGGGYVITGGAAEFNFTEFEGNSVSAPEGSARGGGLHVLVGSVVLNQAEVEENSVSGLVAEGGGIYSVQAGNVDTDLSEIEDNEPNNCDSLDSGEFC